MRVEQIGRATLYLGDCREVIGETPPIDLVVTSPPYDNLREYGEGFKPLDCAPVISGLASAIKPGGVIMWNVADATVNGSETGTSFRQALHAMECGLNLHDTMIYIKDGANFPDANRYYAAFEYMFVWSKGPPATFNPICDRRNKWAGTAVHGTQRQADGATKPMHGIGKPIQPFGVRLNYWLLTNRSNATGHPAPMPYAMAADHITTWSNPGDTVFDPFLGSGTSGVAAAKLGRDFIGCEIDPAYFDIACKRIEQAQRQGDFSGGDVR